MRIPYLQTMHLYSRRWPLAGSISLPYVVLAANAIVHVHNHSRYSSGDHTRVHYLAWWLFRYRRLESQYRLVHAPKTPRRLAGTKHSLPHDWLYVNPAHHPLSRIAKTVYLAAITLSSSATKPLALIRTSNEPTYRERL